MRIFSILFKVILMIFFFAGLIYLVLPGPSTIKDFQPVNTSVFATEWWNNAYPETESYYMNIRRKEITEHYQDEYQMAYCNKDSFLGLNKLFCLIRPFKLNHPPEEVHDRIQKEMKSTFFEEYYYPFRETLLVSGYEPFNKKGLPFKVGVKPVIVGDKYYNTQINIKFIPSSPYAKILVYILMWGLMIAMFKFVKNIFYEKH